MSTTQQPTDADQTDETEILTDGGSRQPDTPAKALLEDAAGL